MPREENDEKTILLFAAALLLVNANILAYDFRQVIFGNQYEQIKEMTAILSYTGDDDTLVLSNIWANLNCNVNHYWQLVDRE